MDSAATNRAAVADVVARFQPITLEQMDGVRLMNRVDTKFVLPETQLAQLLGLLGDSYQALEVAGIRQTQYASLYFDSSSRGCYHDHHRGKGHRWKYRMREYGKTGVRYFEVKRKNNHGRTIKRRIRIPSIQHQLLPVHQDFLEEVTGTTLELQPQLWSQFARLTLVGRDTVERATIDTCLTFQDVAGQQSSLPNVALVEVKQERRDRSSQLFQALRQMRIAPMRISKYCVGSVLLEPSLKHNRFKTRFTALRAAAAVEG